MQTFQIDQVIDRIHPVGRTLYRPEQAALFFNWTCSGFELWFWGSCLTAEFIAIPGQETEIEPRSGAAVLRETWPWATVVLDNGSTVSREFEINGETQSHLLFRCGEPQLHRIRILKQTENGKGYLGLRKLIMDGELLPIPAMKRRKTITFIGDSITCGFGNGTKDSTRGFYASEEKGWMAHGAITARLLDMDAEIISSSGIAVTRFPGWSHDYGMDELYACTDRMLEDRLGAAVYTPWDFSRVRTDYVVLNLGTNDANAIQQMGPEAGIPLHREKYVDFLKMLRRLHGTEARIICALGPMDYYLFPEICAAVKAYAEDSGDRNVFCFRYPKMDYRDPVGACGHPHMITDEKMGHAMAEYINELESNS